MAGEGKRKVTEKQVDELNIHTEVLHDTYGNAYQISNEYLQQQIEQRNPSEDRQIQLIAARQLIESQMRELSPSQREIMALVIAKVSQSKIAKRLQISRRSVRTHIQRARKKLKKLISTTQEVIQNVKSNVNEGDVSS